MSKEASKEKMRRDHLRGDNRNVRSPWKCKPLIPRSKSYVPKVQDAKSAAVSFALAGKQVSKKSVTLPVVRFTDLKD